MTTILNNIYHGVQTRNIAIIVMILFAIWMAWKFIVITVMLIKKKNNESKLKKMQKNIINKLLELQNINGGSVKLPEVNMCPDGKIEINLEDLSPIWTPPPKPPEETVVAETNDQQTANDIHQTQDANMTSKRLENLEKRFEESKVNNRLLKLKLSEFKEENTNLKKELQKYTEALK